MNIKDLRSKTVDELKAELLKVRKDLFNTRFQKVGGQLENTAIISGLRKQVARIKTLLTEKNR